MNPNSQLNTTLNDEIEGKSQLKKFDWIWLPCQTCDPSYKMGTTQ